MLPLSSIMGPRRDAVHASAAGKYMRSKQRSDAAPILSPSLPEGAKDGAGVPINKHFYIAWQLSMMTELSDQLGNLVLTTFTLHIE